MNEAPYRDNPDRWHAPSWMLHPALLSLALVAAIIAVYWPVLGFDFVNYDDPDYFYSNRHVLGGLNPSGIFWAFTTGHAGNWHPLTWLSLMLDSTLFGKDAFGPHLTNVLLHCANAVLLFLWVRALTGARWTGLLVAALFALHPLHVESVAWIAERKDVLSTFFGLLALFAYTRYGQQNTVPATKANRDYRAAIVCFGCSLMSKPMLVTMPFLLLMLDVYPLNRVPAGQPRQALRSLFSEKLPFFILAGASSVITFIAQHEGGAVVSLLRVPIGVRIGNAFVSYASYLEKTFWPSKLAVLYPHPENLDLSLVLISVSIVIGLTAISLLYIRKFPCGTFGWFWFIGTMVPVIGIVQVGNQAMADRYTYVPLIGIFMVAGCGLAVVSKRFSSGPGVVATGAILVLAVCAARTSGQIAFWENSETLFTHTVAVTKNNWLAYNNLGTWFSSRNRPDQAMDCFQKSLQIRAENPEALYNIGNIYARVGEWEKAISYYRQSLTLDPRQPDTLNNLGFALAAMKQLDEAIPYFEAALKFAPDASNTHNNLAAALHQQHRYDEAVKHYQVALRFMRDEPRIWANLGDAQFKRGHITEAIAAYEKAHQLMPEDPHITSRLQAFKQGLENYNRSQAK